MNPITVEEAENKKALLSKLYFLISLMTFSTVLYHVKQGRLNWMESEELIPENETKLSPGKFTMSLLDCLSKTIFYFLFVAFQYARMLNVPKATVIRIKGVEVMGRKDYDKETFDLSQHIQEEESLSVDPERKFLKVIK